MERQLTALTSILFLVLATTAVAGLPSFFDELYAEYSAEYAEHTNGDYLALCSELGLDSASAANQRLFGEVSFLHDLITGVAAENCRSGGMLRIPYFWHWVEPNPRHSIVSLPDSVSLVDVPSPSGYERYKSAADLDRVPELFFSDLVTDEPRYAHESCGQFFTFGWCSEREMAFVSMMGCLGYEGKVCQSGIHSWSELWCEFAANHGRSVRVIARVDNTFDSLEWFPVPLGISLDEWLADVGQGADVDWYNSTARSERQRRALDEIEVSEIAAARIRALVSEALMSAAARADSVDASNQFHMLAVAPAIGAEQWTRLAEGMELGRFKTGVSAVVGDSTVTVLRVDPAHWEFVLLSSQDAGKTAKRWCESEGLSVATNAGMFAADYRTHVGFMRGGDQTNSSRWNHYQSVAAFEPRSDGDRPFRIFDLDDPSVSSQDVDVRYTCVVQNLRLIKRPRINRWAQQEKMWSEMALGEDSKGRALLIFWRSTYSMHDFNDILLSLPIDIVAAQHLEGGPPAQLYINVDDTQLEVLGSYETGINENDDNSHAWSISNVLGIRPREQ